jgi:DNA-binding transcriptional LysR family regulator
MMIPVKLGKLISAEAAARLFLLAAATLSAVSMLLAIPSLIAGDFGQGLLLIGVAVFAGWMATAIHQFQQRLAGIDEVVRQGKRRVEQSEAALEEMRRLAKSIRTTSAADESEEDRTVH